MTLIDLTAQVRGSPALTVFYVTLLPIIGVAMAAIAAAQLTEDSSDIACEDKLPAINRRRMFGILFALLAVTRFLTLFAIFSVAMRYVQIVAVSALVVSSVTTAVYVCRARWGGH